ncbi:DUF2333 family protein [uncultured Desulfosarcina sp.]|uniref:DUF2333 family protein n=1 Tax=uncultured Desulfosarcina sp. TaxID=218289 RepID=UPI0029C70C96|nr:DUF2333 family protein [uncultured Desulfosarcina sp.]
MEKNAKGFEFRKFATPRIIGGIAIAVIILWALSIIFSSPQGQSSKNTGARQPDSAASTSPPGSDGHSKPMLADYPSKAPGAAKGHTTATADTTDQGTPAVQETAGSHGATAAHETASHGSSVMTAGSADDEQPTTHQQPVVAPGHSAQTSGHGAGQTAAEPSTTIGHPLAATAVVAPVHKPTPKGVAFVEAVIKPLRYELEERWWGWRPNDIIDVTDNVNNFQMGVLEVTRRAAVALAERISRTGTTDAFDKNLEQAMNWFMVKASSYWFPSAESKYREGLEEMEAYLVKLRAGNATFYTRTDNLIPLLASFEDLLGSCDENLVKQVNSDGTPMSFFSADDHFFYTQGVASSMATVLEAVHHDFLSTLESRHATELLHHAIVSCQRAAEIDPWIILDRNLSSVFANHRANMAAPVSHARFYLGQLIKTLST